ncbi:hypothetical protein [Paraburkholderia phenoliruptrix]|uniref:hypothetical protein n=1 Tax=Paraburkholderia phenoliruptrix TaxID=252970 RepID=UPI0034CFF56E
MSKHVFTVKRVHDERVDYSLDGELLVSANHDDHGWAGMEEIDKLVKLIAGKIGADVVEVDAEEGDE